MGGMGGQLFQSEDGHCTHIILQNETDDTLGSVNEL
jgi:hypothetical protein